MQKFNQSPRSVVMVRPKFFFPNPETESDNGFQNDGKSFDRKEINNKAFEEATIAAEILRKNGATVHQFEDESTLTPDSVFPNNWFSTHSDGTVILYPMYSQNRRMERRSDILDFLSEHYLVKRNIDYSELEHKSIYLEGTGAMVLDHQNKLAYAVKSKRMNETALKLFCEELDYAPIVFSATDKNGTAVYHTNVLMCVATDFVLIALEMIRDITERVRIKQAITSSGKEIIEITEKQVENFAGNALEITTNQGRLLAISSTAISALNKYQIEKLENYLKIISLDVKTIELAGGSVRCMLAGIHL